MPRSITLIDAGLFQMVCSDNGLAHPSGFPVATQLCHVFSLLPLPGVLPGNIFSAFFGALTVSLFYLFCLQIELNRVDSLVAASLVAVSGIFWSQAIVIEVYTLHTFALVTMMILCRLYLRSNDLRYLLLLIFTTALALTNHWPLVLICGLSMVALFCPALISQPRHLLNAKVIIPGLFALALGLSPYLLLLTKNDHYMLTHGPINSWAEWLGYITRQSYDYTFAGDKDLSLEYLWWLPLQSFTQFSYLGLILIPLGMIRSIWDLKPSVSLALILLWAGNCFILPLLTSYPFGYGMQSILVTWILSTSFSCALWLTIALRFLARQIPTKSDRIMPLVIYPAILLIVAFSNSETSFRASETLVDQYARLLLQSLDKDAVLIVEDDNQTGPIGYLHHIEGVRPDVEIRSANNILFGNRLISPHRSTEDQVQVLDEFIRNAARPVYFISNRELPATDYGLYFKYNESGSEFKIDPTVDVYLSELVLKKATGQTNDPMTRLLIDEVIYGYARQIVGMGITGQNHSTAFSQKLQNVMGTLQGKIWLLHHILGANRESADKATLLEIARAGEDQINSSTAQTASSRFFQYVAEVWALAPANLDQSFYYYQKAISYQMNDEICKSSSRILSEEMNRRLGCG